MNIGIVGAEAAKFTPKGEAAARDIIRSLLHKGDVVVSGHCHLGGIDIWAEEIADELKLGKIIHPPKQFNWNNGYKPRNILIAKDSIEVHCIAVDILPKNYNGMRFAYCYHHQGESMIPNHVKSGGCWTMKYAREIGKISVLHVVTN